MKCPASQNPAYSFYWQQMGFFPEVGHRTDCGVLQFLDSVSVSPFVYCSHYAVQYLRFESSDCTRWSSAGSGSKLLNQYGLRVYPKLAECCGWPGQRMSACLQTRPSHYSQHPHIFSPRAWSKLCKTIITQDSVLARTRTKAIVRRPLGDILMIMVDFSIAKLHCSRLVQF